MSASITKNTVADGVYNGVYSKLDGWQADIYCWMTRLPESEIIKYSYEIDYRSMPYTFYSGDGFWQIGIWLSRAEKTTSNVAQIRGGF